jgi:hypothetical protein
LEKEKNQITELEKKLAEIKQTINSYLENESTKKFVLADSIVTSEKAQQAISKLLAEIKPK